MRQFNPEQEVPSLELCKRLKELGYPQEGGGWYWIKKRSKYYLAYRLDDSTLISFKFFEPITEEILYIDPYISPGVMDKGAFLKTNNIFKAPTVRELGEWLPVGIVPFTTNASPLIYRFHQCFDSLEGWKLEYVKEGVNPWHSEEDKSEANARALMLIWLAENGYINFTEADNDR